MARAFLVLAYLPVATAAAGAAGRIAAFEGHARDSIPRAGLVQTPVARQPRAHVAVVHVAVPHTRERKHVHRPPVLIPSETHFESITDGTPTPAIRQDENKILRGESTPQPDTKHAEVLNGRAPPLRPTIVNGQSAAPSDDDSFVDVVAVGDEHGLYCTGTLIAPRAVLTARHCLPADRVVFGARIDQPLREQRASAARSGEGPELDVALLILDDAAPIAPRELRAAGDTRAPLGLVRLVGFGTNDPGGQRGFGIKRFADAPVSGWGCDLRRAETLGCDPDVDLVVNRAGGRDTCDGDSGGPVFERRNNRWVLIATTSRPIASSSVRCGDGGVYVRVDQVRAWIDAELSAIGASQP